MCVCVIERSRKRDSAVALNPKNFRHCTTWVEAVATWPHLSPLSGLQNREMLTMATLADRTSAADEGNRRQEGRTKNANIARNV